MEEPLDQWFFPRIRDGHVACLPAPDCSPAKRAQNRASRFA